MTRNDKKRIVDQIQQYADEVLGQVDKEQVPISAQIDLLKPKMEELAAKYETDVTNIFIIYMDGISEEQAVKEQQFQEKIQE